MNPFYSLVYNGIVLPALQVGFRVLSPFSQKINIGLRERHGLIERVRTFRDRVGEKPVLLFHCASAGEFESLRPLSKEFDRSEVALAVSFFSPSAKRLVATSDEFDFADYSPVDSRSQVEEYLSAMRPSLIAITKHDVWPNFVWTASARKIPLFLINGNFHADSMKLWPGSRAFHRSVYSCFTEIMTVSEEDRQRATLLAGTTARVVTIGDSRFDQTLARALSNAALPERLINVCKGRKVIVAGSTHFDDENLLFPVLADLKREVPETLTLIVPHDPSPKARRRIEDFSLQYGLKVESLETVTKPNGANLILINKSGILANLYRLGQIAYVGGGFGKGVHSVLEPMANGLPVLCGVNIGVSNEARVASKLGIVEVVDGRNQTHAILEKWLTDERALKELGTRSRSYVEQNSGISHKVSERLKETLHDHA